ncbi:hypothetical protein A5731_07110 [Mycolicibacterium conceptionense]|jgi:hypothetical protein|uniref:Uncharacterized protein n=3 Tax=Mycolicibacterium TaxID=1866885 RepID=A0A0J8UBF8_9MYCO|nr:MULTISPECIES: hypothetical protein [Mycolicibacterium]KLI09435.1 hypothetical protein AA982_05315 [Mycolicibacterium senegalense]KLO47828.1 hypothetical protein ABW05_32340 [Mycolicibacterium senegalense]KMV17690.1 hypothetical protein ACT17_15620 [Mycolicibacterium conceptionense]MCW1820813.1 hypothetical protein [Mycolicibacterium senegalense]OBB14218.1 hypothetical protein A5718_02485 [Mycolicibacterium conceptionense]
MSTDPDQLRAQVAEVLAGVPDPAVDPSALEGMDIDVVAARLEQAHDLLVQALESVDRGQPGGSQAAER